ncbi:uncharacterized protein [Henckelia pumila]|uniref:uncharacterized protein n=1 Tax=Henckelia pumila TaxID=405737 RepID=UPI003C6DBA01
MAPYEVLYGRRCRTPLHWDEVGDRAVLEPKIVTQMVDVIAKIRDRMLSAQSRQKSYADQRRRNLEFLVGSMWPSHVIRHEPVERTPDLSYEEMPVKILDRQVRRLRNREIPMVKVLWRNQLVEEATLETKQDMRARYPELFACLSSSLPIWVVTLSLSVKVGWFALSLLGKSSIGFSAPAMISSMSFIVFTYLSSSVKNL